MSLEKQAEKLIEAVSTLVTSVNELVIAQSKAPAPGAGLSNNAAAQSGGEKAPTKKEIAKLQTDAKLKAGAVMKNCGKDALRGLLDNFGVSKFTELTAGVNVFEDFITRADALLAAPKVEEDDDLLGDGPSSVTAKEYTAEDVKAKFLEVNNHKDLGKDVTKQLLAELGVTRLPQLTKERFSEAIKMVQKALDNAVAL